MITDEQLREWAADTKLFTLNVVSAELLVLRNQVRAQLVAAALTGLLAFNSNRIASNAADLAVAMADATLSAMRRKP